MFVCERSSYHAKLETEEPATTYEKGYKHYESGFLHACLCTRT